MNKHSENLQEIIKTLPDSPGVYQFFDKTARMIYAGKAKSIRKRVQSYFREPYDNNKIEVLVKQIKDIRCIIVSNESEALLLENNLIKEHQPKYNVKLKDDKTFPWICVTKEDFPRVFSTRSIVRNGSKYYGPFVSLKFLRALTDLIRQLYPLRTCRLALTEESIADKKYKRCLEFHLENCKAPCENLQSREEYNSNITEIQQILRGDIGSILRKFKDLMYKHSGKHEFEKAQAIKEKIELLSGYQSKSVVVNPDITDVDVFSIVSDEKYGYVNYLKILNGAIVQSYTTELQKKLDESDEELISIAIAECRQRFESCAKEIIIPFQLDIEIPDTNFIVPQIGDKKKLLKLSENNIQYYKAKKQLHSPAPDRSARILEQMKKDLRLKEIPVHIECFDVSNIQGKFAVASMVVFRNARPLKKEYRHYNIKTVEGANDYASIEEIVYRRYKRLLDEEQPLPQLIIIDGGKGQLSASVKSLKKTGMTGKAGVIGIAKKLEEIYYPGDPVPLYLNKKSETLRLIQHIRNEAHRFGITHHRNKREKETIKTELTEIKGIGKAAAQKLLKKYGSVNAVKALKISELEDTIGKAKAKIVFEYFRALGKL